MAGSPPFFELVREVPAGRLVVELTEHDRVDDYAYLLQALTRLRDLGARIAVDDAGSGFASLQHILNIRPDIIKLDLALTRDIDTDPARRALASSLVMFGRDIGAVIIAEGIETRDELDTIRALGLQHGQGFYLAHPSELPVPKWLVSVTG
jgi:EAL domain-containing protein (putative c-di-GMP-specific phosphodiesterase class I)